MSTENKPQTRFDFTEAKLAALKRPIAKDAVYRDSAVKGLLVRVSYRTGLKSYYIDYRGPSGEHPKKCLGEVGDPRSNPDALSLKDARLKATEVKVASAKGTDLLAPPPGSTISSLSDRYKDAKTRSPETIRMLNQDIVPTFGGRSFITIKTYEITAWHRALCKKTPHRNERGNVVKTKGGQHAADKALDVLKALINFGMAQELIPFGRNPCMAVERNFSQIETERHFDWSDAELATLAAKLVQYEKIAREGEQTGLTGVNIRDAKGRIVSHYPSLATIYAYKFLILTGVRKSEALTLRWDQVKADRGHIVWTKYKMRRRKLVPRPMYRAITSPLAQLLSALEEIRVNEYVFPGKRGTGHLVEIDGVWERIRTEAKFFRTLDDGKIQYARLHDLRHWYGDEAANAGLNEKQIMALMGHSSTQVSARYSKGSIRHHAANAEQVAIAMAKILNVA